MLIDRRRFLTASALAATACGALPAGAADDAEPPTNDDGLHIQKWFLESFLDLQDDLEAAAQAGKQLAVIFEQRGCPYCRELHRVNFGKRQIVDYLTKNFTVLQLNLWGSREVTDFDGKAMEERALARRWKVNFTPSMVFLPADPEAVKGKSGGEAEIFRMPGYFKPFHFLAALEYVREGHWKTEDFQRYLQRRFEAIRERGEKPDVW